MITTPASCKQIIREIIISRFLFRRWKSEEKFIQSFALIDHVACEGFKSFYMSVLDEQTWYRVYKAIHQWTIFRI